MSTSGLIALSTYNLITFEDFDAQDGVENRTMICGSLISGNAADFAIIINQTTFPPNAFSLEINKQLTSGSAFQIYAGSFALGTNLTHTIVVKIANTSYRVDNRTVVFGQGNEGATVVLDSNLTDRCITMENNLKILSNQFSMLTNTTGNNISIPVSTSDQLTFFVNTLDTYGRAVFNVDGNTILSNNYVTEIQIHVNNSIINHVQLIIINLSGINISFSKGSMSGTWLNTTALGKTHTLWNFYEATFLKLRHVWIGALLAPYASVTTNNNIEGVTVVKSLKTSAQIRDPPLTYPFC